MISMRRRHSDASAATAARGALLALAFAAAAAACAHGGAAPPPLSAVLGPVAPEARLYYDDAGGFPDSARIVVREAARWREIWQQATSKRPSPPPMPQVDFDRDMVVVVAAGRRKAEDQIRVDSVGVRKERDAAGNEHDALAVVVRTIQGCGNFNADAYPVEVVRVRRFTGPVTFIERQDRATDCGPADRSR